MRCLRGRRSASHSPATSEALKLDRNADEPHATHDWRVRHGLSANRMDLVIQAPSIDSAELTSIAELAGAQGIVVLHASEDMAFRLLRAQSRTGVANVCAAAK